MCRVLFQDRPELTHWIQLINYGNKQEFNKLNLVCWCWAGTKTCKPCISRDQAWGSLLFKLTISLKLLRFLCSFLSNQEFDNAEGEECSGGSSPAQEDSLSSCPSLPEVYTLPLRDRANCPALQDGSGN